MGLAGRGKCIRSRYLTAVFPNPDHTVKYKVRDNAAIHSQFHHFRQRPYEFIWFFSFREPASTTQSSSTMSSPRSFWMTHQTKMSLCCETYFEYILLSFDEGVFKNHNEPLSQYKTAVLGIGKLSFFCSKLRIPRQGQCKNHRSPSTRDMFGDDDDQHSIW